MTPPNPTWEDVEQSNSFVNTLMKLCLIGLDPRTMPNIAGLFYVAYVREELGINPDSGVINEWAKAWAADLRPRFEQYADVIDASVEEFTQRGYDDAY